MTQLLGIYYLGKVVISLTLMMFFMVFLFLEHAFLTKDENYFGLPLPPKQSSKSILEIREAAESKKKA